MEMSGVNTSVNSNRYAAMGTESKYTGSDFEDEDDVESDTSDSSVDDSDVVVGSGGRPYTNKFGVTHMVYQGVSRYPQLTQQTLSSSDPAEGQLCQFQQQEWKAQQQQDPFPGDWNSSLNQ